jgi:hypothetical protein
MRDVTRALRRVGDYETMREMKAANLDAAQTVADQSKVEVPVRSGKLQRTIKASGTSRESFVRAGTPKQVPYANPVHWGWARRGIRPQPFVYEAWDKRINEVKDAYEKQLKKLRRRVGL